MPTIEPLVASIFSREALKKRRELKTTLLHRPGGVWHQSEINCLVKGLTTEVTSISSHPEHLILFGHFTKEQTLEALLGGTAYTATMMTGVDGLPFDPGWTV